MSGRSASIGGTLAGGIQDVAALLPLIGTEQCEIHVGSALEGGYLYAAATPLSIFGSLGIVKAGMSILFSSISIPIPKIFISFQNSKPTIKYSTHRKWLGARILKDAGFKLSGTVAPLIGMDGHCFKAETRLLEILEEKHIDNPEKVSIDWKSWKWNIMLAILTTLGAALSITPYIPLLVGPASWRPSAIHLPWLYPALRIIGSSFSTVACQFMIQFRVISLMKNRILFMTICQRLNAIYGQGFKASQKNLKFQWNAGLPAEQCILSLEHHISSVGPLTRLVQNSDKVEICHAIQKDTVSMSELTSEDWYNMSEGTLEGSDHISIPMISPFPHHAGVPTQPLSPSPSSLSSSKRVLSFSIDDLHQLQQEHFPTPTRDAAFIVVLSIILGLSLLATVIGYIGCFTLVNAAPALGNGPLVWASLEAALSIFRILIWASNPSFDEETEVTIGLTLSKHQPMLTTDDYNPHITDPNHEEKKPLTLVPEHEFLERITPYTGPLDRFQKADNITLYFTLTADYGRCDDSEARRKSEGTVSKKWSESQCLYMTVFDVNKQIGVMFMSSKTSFYYFDVMVKYNTISNQFQANVESEQREVHPWRVEDDNFFNSLQNYYQYVIDAFNQRNINIHTATLWWKWDLSEKSRPTNRQTQHGSSGFQNEKLPLSTPKTQLYLDCGYEHQLKTTLIDTWSQWIILDMDKIRLDKRRDCYESLRDPTSEKAKWELTELDAQLVLGWARRELVLVELSKELEDILQAKMETCISEVDYIQKDLHLLMWMSSGFESGRVKRMELEREKAKKRMEKGMTAANEQADREGRPWQGDQAFDPKWKEVIKLIDNQWLAEIVCRKDVLKGSEDELKRVIRDSIKAGRRANRDRVEFVERLESRLSHEHWDLQHGYEEKMMKAGIERIRIVPPDSTRKELDIAYAYPRPDAVATAKFVQLNYSSSRGKACSAIVYDAISAFGDNLEDLCNVIAKSTTRSVINVHPDIVNSIPPNDDLLFLSSYGSVKVPAFIQRNRDKWWDQQKANSSMVYFTPMAIIDDSCYCEGGTIARILLFLTAPSAIQISVVHCGEIGLANLSIQKRGEELQSISDIPLTFQLDNFQPFVLEEGRHELELVPHWEPELERSFGDMYLLRDIVVKFSNDTVIDSNPAQSNQGLWSTIDNEPLVDPEGTVD